MNTVLLLPALFSSDGGIERILRLYVRAIGELTPSGGAVRAVVLNDFSAQITEDRLRAYGTPALHGMAGCGRNKIACVWHMIRIGRRSQRVVCGHINLLRLAHFARRFSQKLEVWLVAHGIEVWRPFSTAERRALLATRRILCVSEYTRGQLRDHCPGLTADQLALQPNALDPSFEQPTPVTGKTVPGRILSVARLNATEAYKGIDHLIAAMPAIRSSVPHAHLCVVGDGDDRPRLETLAAASPKMPVTFTGRVGDNVLREHFEQCQLFALPSRGEGFGLVYLEAMSHGKPCLAANAGGAPEVISAASGALVRYGDVDGIATAVIAALEREWNIESIRARAREFSYPNFKVQLAAILARAA